VIYIHFARSYGPRENSAEGEEILHPGSQEVLVPEEPLCILEEKMEPEEQNETPQKR
jgi:hypothetical protein